MFPSTRYTFPSVIFLSLCSQSATLAAPLSVPVSVDRVNLLSWHPSVHTSIILYLCFFITPTFLHPFLLSFPSSECSSFSPPTTVILLILLCFEGLLFFIFTGVMFGTQIHSICTDETVSCTLILNC